MILSPFWVLAAWQHQNYAHYDREYQKRNLKILKEEKYTGDMVQINGKTRAVISISADASKDEAIAAGKEAVADKLTGTIVKEIYVPKKIINIVQK